MANATVAAHSPIRRAVVYLHRETHIGQVAAITHQLIDAVRRVNSPL